MTQSVRSAPTDLAKGGVGRSSDADRQFVTVTVDGQEFGLPVRQVQDVLAPTRITPVPLAAREVAGSLNLRGRIVTAIDLRSRLDLEPAPVGLERMNVVVEFQGDLYSLLVDEVGEVLTPDAESFEPNPPTLDPRWREVSTGIFRLDGRLLVVADVSRLLTFDRRLADAA